MVFAKAELVVHGTCRVSEESDPKNWDMQQSMSMSTAHKQRESALEKNTCCTTEGDVWRGHKPHNLAHTHSLSLFTIPQMFK